MNAERIGTTTKMLWKVAQHFLEQGKGPSALLFFKTIPAESFKKFHAQGQPYYLYEALKKGTHEVVSHALECGLTILPEHQSNGITLLCGWLKKNEHLGSSLKDVPHLKDTYYDTLLRTFLKQGVSYTVNNQNSDNILHLMLGELPASRFETTLCKHIEKYVPDLFLQRNAQGLTPLLQAVENEAWPWARDYITYSDITAVDSSGNTSLHIAAQKNSPKNIQNMLGFLEKVWQRSANHKIWEQTNSAGETVLSLLDNTLSSYSQEKKTWNSRIHSLPNHPRPHDH